MSILSRVTSFKCFDHYVFNGVSLILNKSFIKWYQFNVWMVLIGKVWFSSKTWETSISRFSLSREPLSIVDSISSVKTRLKSLWTMRPATKFFQIYQFPQWVIRHFDNSCGMFRISTLSTNQICCGWNLTWRAVWIGRPRKDGAGTSLGLEGLKRE